MQVKSPGLKRQLGQGAFGDMYRIWNWRKCRNSDCQENVAYPWPRREVGLRLRPVGLRFRPVGLRFRLVGLRFRPVGLRFRPVGLRFRPVGLRFRPVGLRFRPVGLRFRPQGLRSSVFVFGSSFSTHPTQFNIIQRLLINNCWTLVQLVDQNKNDWSKPFNKQLLDKTSHDTMLNIILLSSSCNICCSTNVESSLANLHNIVAVIKRMSCQSKFILSKLESLLPCY